MSPYPLTHTTSQIQKKEGSTEAGNIGDSWLEQWRTRTTTVTSVSNHEVRRNIILNRQAHRIIWYLVRTPKGKNSYHPNQPLRNRHSCTATRSVRYGTVRYGTVQIRYGTVRYGTVRRHITSQHQQSAIRTRIEVTRLNFEWVSGDTKSIQCKFHYKRRRNTIQYTTI